MAAKVRKIHAERIDERGRSGVFTNEKVLPDWQERLFSIQLESADDHIIYLAAADRNTFTGHAVDIVGE